MFIEYNLWGMIFILLFIVFLIAIVIWEWEFHYTNGHYFIKQQLHYWENWIEKQDEYWREWWRHLSALRKIYFVLAVIVSPIFIGSFVLIFPQFIIKVYDDETTFYNLSLAVFAILSGLGAVFGFYTSIMRTEIQEHGMITDRINKATEGLGKRDENGDAVLEMRLGALLALERIAQDSFRDHIQIMEILCAYIRTNSPWIKTEDERRVESEKLLDSELRRRADIQVALTIIGRRTRWPNGKKRLEKEKEQGYSLDLSRSDLRATQISKTSLNDANFTSSNLRFAGISKSQLNNANFSGAIMICASFNEVSLINVNFRGTKLGSARFEKTNLTDAYFIGAHLRHTSFKNTEMNNTIIRLACILGTRFEETNLEGVSFDDATIKNTNEHGDEEVESGRFRSKPIFLNSNLNNVTFERAKIDKAIFHRTSLENIDFTQAELSNVSFIETNIKDTQFDSADLTNVKFDKSSITNINIAKAFAYEGDFFDWQFTQDQFNAMFIKFPEVRTPQDIIIQPHWPKNILSYDEFKAAYNQWKSAKYVEELAIAKNYQENMKQRLEIIKRNKK